MTTLEVVQPTQHSTRQRTRSTVALVVTVLAVAALLVVLGGGSGQSDPLDPRNPGAEGAEALARVLADEGVDVRVVRGQAALLGTPVGSGTTVVVTGVDALGPSTLRTLQRHTRGAASVVLAGDGPALEDAFDLEPGDHGAGTVEPGCEDPLFRGLELSVRPGSSYRSTGRDPCFVLNGQGLLLQPRERERLLLASDVLTNEAVTEADNAAVALRLLGQQPRLVWYVADVDDLDASDAVGLSAVLPRWVVPGLVLIGLAVAAFLLWQGRRLGPLVVEPLPVAVRATEATESRGRLYERARDRDHVAVILRRATTGRLRARLALPRDLAIAEVAVAASRATGRSVESIRTLLTDSPVPDDAALARLGHALTVLEDEVHPT